jgi:site-specific DNA-methyltransferase (adenine-specific)
MTTHGQTLLFGDSLSFLRQLHTNTVDAIITDPPYGIRILNQKWDYDVPSVDVWSECLRLLKPGGYLLSFAGTRTQHKMAVNIENAGFEIRDMIAWVYGGGMPKSTDISKVIDKVAGVDREVIGRYKRPDGTLRNYEEWNKSNGVWSDDSRYKYKKQGCPVTAPATEDAKKWNGWGTGLRTGLEPITMARKPFKGSTIDNVLTYGTGAININDCRIEIDNKEIKVNATNEIELGRFPGNLIHDGSNEVLEIFPTSKEGSAARFFYCAKASKADKGINNIHPTVKPTKLMRYLCKLVTPPGGVVLDPFMGSGTTGVAAVLEKFKFIGIELNEEYIEICNSRIQNAEKSLQTTLF